MSRKLCNSQIYPSTNAVKEESRSQDADLAGSAQALFGENAATAVALCGIEAWFEGKDTELVRWASVFRSLQH